MRRQFSRNPFEPRPFELEWFSQHIGCAGSRERHYAAGVTAEVVLLGGVRGDRSTVLRGLEDEFPPRGWQTHRCKLIAHLSLLSSAVLLSTDPYVLPWLDPGSIHAVEPA